MRACVHLCIFVAHVLSALPCMAGQLSAVPCFKSGVPLASSDCALGRSSAAASFPRSAFCAWRRHLPSGARISMSHRGYSAGPRRGQQRDYHRTVLKPKGLGPLIASVMPCAKVPQRLLRIPLLLSCSHVCLSAHVCQHPRGGMCPRRGGTSVSRLCSSAWLLAQPENRK